MIKESSRTPSKLYPVYISGPKGVIEGKAVVRIWSPQEQKKRAIKKTFKLCALFIACLLPFAILEPFLFMIWGSIAFFGILGIVAPLIYGKYVDEDATFFEVQIQCPHCFQNETPLVPYLHSRFEDEFSALCKTCGQTSRVMKR